MAISHTNPSTVSSRFLGRNPRAYALLLAILTVVSYTTACDGSDLRAELLPGTQRIEPNDNGPWFTISPSERWLAFMEVDSNGVGEAGTNFHLTTLEINTANKTSHQLSDVPATLFRETLTQWQSIQIGFAADSWRDDRLLIRLPSSTPIKYWVAFVPGTSEANVTAEPDDLSCSDCPPRSEWRRLAESRRLPVHDDNGPRPYVPYREGRFSDVVYRYPMGGDFRGAIVEKVYSDGSVEVLIEQKRAFREAHIGAFRVSPDEQYLAYELILWLKSPIPLPTTRHELHIFHIPTGEEQRLPGDYRLMGNLIWSADSKRLFCALVDGDAADGIGDGVYRIDMSRQ